MPAGSVALTYPYVDTESNQFASVFLQNQGAMLDQVVSGMRFKLIGGFGWFPSPSGHFGSTSPAVLEPKSVQDLVRCRVLGRNAAAARVVKRRVLFQRICDTFFENMT